MAYNSFRAENSAYMRLNQVKQQSGSGRLLFVCDTSAMGEKHWLWNASEEYFYSKLTLRSTIPEKEGQRMHVMVDAWNDNASGLYDVGKKRDAIFLSPLAKWDFSIKEFERGDGQLTLRASYIMLEKHQEADHSYWKNGGKAVGVVTLVLPPSPLRAAAASSDPDTPKPTTSKATSCKGTNSKGATSKGATSKGATSKGTFSRKEKP